MKTIPQILVILLFTFELFSCAEQTWENGDTTQETVAENVEGSLKNTKLKMNTEENLLAKDDLKNNITSAEEKVFQNLNLYESDELVQIVLKDESDSIRNQTDFKNGAQNITKYLVKENTKPSSSLEASENSNLIESALIQIVLKDFKILTNTQSEQENLTEVSTESLIKADATSTRDANNLTTESLISLKTFSTSNSSEKEMIQIAVKDVTNLTKNPNEIDDTAEVSTESLAKEGTTSTAEKHSTTNPLSTLETTHNSNLAESDLIRIVLMDNKNLENNQKKDKDTEEISTESSLVGVESTTTPHEDEKTTRPLISLEEYAVRQMNFILDHLLIETQDFVAKVLEANVNTVFPKDHLKRYAEDINRILKADAYSDYSNEVIKSTHIETLDEIYEKMVKKLNFLKSKSTKLLQKTLPQGWINEYHCKKSELTIWLDKATEEMHSEFNSYMTEEEDHLKYQYFNETFDDISRATEMHHKLALLADLVKNVKNKKQITFMDLYMQT